MSEAATVKRARRNVASAFNVNYDQVEVNESQAGGAAFRFTSDVFVDKLQIGNLREAIKNELGLDALANIVMNESGLDESLLGFTVNSGTMDDAIQRVARMDPSVIRQAAFPGRTLS